MPSPRNLARRKSHKPPNCIRVLVADGSRISCQSLTTSLERVSRKVRVTE